jgi:hypothetical protein
VSVSISRRVTGGFFSKFIFSLAVTVGLAGLSLEATENVETDERSIWHSIVPGTKSTYAELTSGDTLGSEEEIPLLPLPVPALVAGAGLGLAFVVRARWRR